jgi:hypothetical protein
MALTTYRSLVPITTPARKAAAYEHLREMADHAIPLGVDILRVQYMAGSQYIEVDLSAAISAAQATHLGLEVKP